MGGMVDSRRVQAHRVVGRRGFDDCLGVWGNYINQGRLRPKRTKNTDIRATRRYAVVGSGLEPDFSRLSDREKHYLYQTQENGEARRNDNDSMP